MVIAGSRVTPDVLRQVPEQGVGPFGGCSLPGVIGWMRQAGAEVGAGFLVGTFGVDGVFWACAVLELGTGCRAASAPDCARWSPDTPVTRTSPSSPAPRRGLARLGDRPATAKHSGEM